ncbi:MAG: peptidase S16 [Chloroflexi bacterium]|nr:peptidase S16 [Chloroflexota bacterium]
MAQTREIPLFPLGSVLFPGMVLPLHIFEPRYRQMINECIEKNAPFGVVLIRDGVEVGGDAIPHEVGTSAYITQVDRLPGGRMNIQGVGIQRFRIHGVRRDKPYLVGEVEDFPLEGETSPQVETLVEHLTPKLKTYLSTLSQTSNVEVSFDEIPEDGLAFAFLTAIVLPLNSQEKQTLLEQMDLVSVLREEDRFLNRELMLLEVMLRYEHQKRDDDSPFSLN